MRIVMVLVALKKAPVHSLSSSMVASEGDSMQRDYWYSSARLHENLEDPEYIGRKASERAVKRLNGRPIKTTNAPVLFVPSISDEFNWAFYRRY